MEHRQLSCWCNYTNHHHKARRRVRVWTICRNALIWCRANIPIALSLCVEIETWCGHDEKQKYFVERHQIETNRSTIGKRRCSSSVANWRWKAARGPWVRGVTICVTEMSMRPARAAADYHKYCNQPPCTLHHSRLVHIYNTNWEWGHNL